MTATPLTRHAHRDRVLVVADWSIDPEAVVDALAAENARAPAAFALLVPSRLAPGGWSGDPNASRPCARLQLDSVRERAAAGGLSIERGGVTDPERVAAVGEFLDEWAADRIVLVDRRHPLAEGPLGVRRRLARRCRCAVERIVVARRP